jgi:hypothetical protein
MITAEQVAGGLMIRVLSQSINKFSLCRNTTNKGGGACYELKICKDQTVCDANNLKFHLMVPEFGMLW